MSELEKTALITGGSRGIGRAIAERLAKDGFTTYITYVSKPDRAEEVVKTIGSAGGKAEAFRLDSSDDKAVAEFFAENIKGKVKLAVLVNNAGVTADGLIMRMKQDAWDRVLAVNLTGAFNCLREAARIMMKQKSGRIINITSVIGLMGNAGQTNYAASKAGIIGVTKSAARELASRNITVNAVAPGFIATDMTEAWPEEAKKSYMDMIPLSRLGTPEDVAGCVAFLASDDAAYVTGHVLSVNGGLYM